MTDLTTDQLLDLLKSGGYLYPNPDTYSAENYACGHPGFWVKHRDGDQHISDNQWRDLHQTLSGDTL